MGGGELEILLGGDFLLGEGYEIKTKIVGGGRMNKFLAGGGSNHPIIPPVGKTLISTLVWDFFIIIIILISRQLICHVSHTRYKVAFC